MNSPGRPRTRPTAKAPAPAKTEAPRRRGRPPLAQATGGSAPREHLVGCAIGLMHEQGFHATSMADLAERAGLQKGHVSHYFPSKLSLLEAVVEQHIAHTLAWLDAGVDASSDAHGQALSAILRVIEYVKGQEPALTQWGCPLAALALECGRLASQNPALDVGRQPLLQMQAWLTARLRPALGPRLASRHAENTLGALQGAALLSQAQRDNGPLRRMAAALQAQPLPIAAGPR